jgi:hypothetical protein
MKTCQRPRRGQESSLDRGTHASCTFLFYQRGRNGYAKDKGRFEHGNAWRAIFEGDFHSFAHGMPICGSKERPIRLAYGSLRAGCGARDKQSRHRLVRVCLNPALAELGRGTRNYGGTGWVRVGHPPSLQPWTDYYNHQRPHRSLGYKPPISRSDTGTTS